jgi:phage/plasmid-like protein (TIGR03299 family)
MAHELEMNERGDAKMMYAGREPWHGLGTRVDTEVTAEAAIRLAELDTTCEKRPIYLPGSAQVDGIPVIGNEVDSHKAVVRVEDNKVLGVVGNRYHVIQNRECFDFMDDLIGSGQAVYHTAGSLREGRVIFMTVKLPEDSKVGDDVIERYLLLTSSHDGSGALMVQWTPIRVVCMNTLSFALAGGEAQSRVTIRHTQNYTSKISAAREVLKLTERYYSVMEEQFNRLLDQQFTEAHMRDFTQKLFPADDESDVPTRTKNNRQQVFELFYDGRGQKDVAETKWAAYNAVTEYADWFRTVRKSGETEEAEARMNSSLLGSGQALKNRAFNLLTVE